MDFVSLTQDEQWLAIAQNLHGREVEWFHYDLNCRQYESLLSDPSMAELPEEWPAHLAKFRGLSRDEAIRKVSDLPSLMQVQKMEHRDRLRLLLRAEMVERERVGLYHSQLHAAFPDANVRDTALARARQLREARQATP